LFFTSFLNVLSNIEITGFDVLAWFISSGVLPSNIRSIAFLCSSINELSLKLFGSLQISFENIEFLVLKIFSVSLLEVFNLESSNSVTMSNLKKFSGVLNSCLI